MRKQGISLITLIITIVVIIILAAAVVLTINQNNPISSSRVAEIVQTRDSLVSGMIIYTTNVQAKTLGEFSVKDILTTSEYKIIGNGTKHITKDGVQIELFKLDSDLVKEKLNIDLKNQGDLWYIDGNGLVYMVYENIESVPAYFKENENIISSVKNCITYDGESIINEDSQQSGGNDTPEVVTYTVTYNSNGGSGEMASSTGITVTIATNSFTAPAGKEFDSWNTEIDGSGTTYVPGATISANITLYAKWNKVYLASNITSITTEAEKQTVIGKSVTNLTSDNGWTDWKVFSSNGTNIVLITGDYIPVSILPTGHGFASGSHNPDFCVNSSTSRTDLLTKLTTASTFVGFKDSTGKVTEARIPTIDDFVLSYNAVEHDGQTYVDADHENGYPIIQKIYYKDNGVNGGINVSSNVNGVTSNNNVPNNSYWSNYGMPRTDTYYGNLWVIQTGTRAYGYWLATASADNVNRVFRVVNSGNVHGNEYNNTYRALRPIVVLDSSVKLVQHVVGSNITYTLE